MSVVVAEKDAASFIDLASRENLEAVAIARVTAEPRLVMKWNGDTIVSLSRKFLNSNGAKKHAKVRITEPEIIQPDVCVYDDISFEKLIKSPDICSQKGLVDRFDSSIGAGTVIAPFGGKYQLTPSQVMAAKIPVLNGETKTCSLMSWGFDPYISSVSPYHGAVLAVVHSVAKIIAAGGSRSKCRLSFQEYFERLRDDPVRWGKPFCALLGALDAQIGLQTAAIGGKDSMSGSFENIDVPPTLVSFAVSTVKIDNIVTPEFKKTDSLVYLLKPPSAVYEKHDFASLCRYFDGVEQLVAQGKILSSWAAGSGGAAEAVFKMCMGNHIGFEAEKNLEAGCGFSGFVVEAARPLQIEAELLGRTIDEYSLITKSFKVPLEKLQGVWENALEPVYPYLLKQEGKTQKFFFDKGVSIKPKGRYAKPIFIIAVFAGTNSEYDTARAIEKATGRAEIFVIRNLTPADIAQSVKGFEKAVRNAQAIVIPGGFSGGDEPDGSGKFITAFIRNPAVSDAVTELLQKREGLICGICNGFQALVKLGLVPYGEIRDMTELSPTLTFNAIGRHQSVLVRTKVVSNKSPWLSHFEAGAQYIVPVSHGEGRFIAEESLVRNLAANGQIATQYVDFDGNASQDIRFNPNNSSFSIEGITSPDGRVFGRMAHNERFDDGLYRNIPGMRKMDIFSGAVGYFR
jgi:phosphoribosylformylglycinamidine synthase